MRASCLQHLVLGAFLAGLLPAVARGQSPAAPYHDPVPMYRASLPAPNGPYYGGASSFPSFGAPPAHTGAARFPGAQAPSYMPPPDPMFAWQDPSRCELDENGDCTGCRTRGFFMDIGWFGLIRQGLGNSPLALLDPNTVDDGVRPPSDSPVAASFNDLHTGLLSGIRGTFGYAWDDTLIEFAGFYLPEQNDRGTVIMPGQLSLLFFNPPLGFAGNNFLWDNADAIFLILKTEFSNGELNVRWSTGANGTGLELLFGARYIDLQEQLEIRTEDDSIQIAPDPTEVASYFSRTRNHLAGGQAGLATHLALLEWLGLTAQFRGVGFYNIAETDISLVRGDGLIGRSGQLKDRRLSHLYELGFFVDLHQGALRLKFGYNLLWVLGVAEAVDQVDFNLENRFGRGHFDGSIFYHGPSVVLDITF